MSAPARFPRSVATHPDPPVRCVHTAPAPGHAAATCNDGTQAQGAGFGVVLGVCTLLFGLLCLADADYRVWGVVLTVGSALYIALCVALSASALVRLGMDDTYGGPRPTDEE